MDINGITSSLSLVKDVVNQVNLLRNLTTDIEKATEIQGAKQKALDLTNTIIALQGAVMSMQTEYMLLVEENRQLKLAQDKANNYQLVKYPTTDTLTDDIFVYQYIGTEQILHYCCPVCFENGKRSILQQTKKNLSLKTIGEFFECDICNKKYRIGTYYRD